MRVLFVTSEVATLFKLGGLADVSQSLPVALRLAGVDVSIALPYYESIDRPHVTGVGEVIVEMDGSRQHVFVFATRLAGAGRVGPVVYLFRHPMLNGYSGGNMGARFTLFSKAVSTFYTQAHHLVGKMFDIIHCHDWHTAPVLLFVGENDKAHHESGRSDAKNVKTLITIHNLMYQGKVKPAVMESFGIPRSSVHIHESAEGAHVDLLAEAVAHADVVTTVSPTYAKEILADTKGAIGAVLAARKRSVHGILNGIDTHMWNPLTDPTLWATYSRSSVAAGKAWNKKHLARTIHLPRSDDPLIAFVGRIEPRQKGIDILMEAVRHCIDRYGFQLVVLGTGEPETVRQLMMLAKQYATRVSFVHAFDDKLAHRIYAGADVLVVPSKFEPCGLTQMIAMRYGTIPLVRKTGGLADTVVDGKNGFVFDTYEGQVLAKKMGEVIQYFHEDKSGWKRMVSHAMKEDFSWEKSARLYRQIYTNLMR